MILPSEFRPKKLCISNGWITSLRISFPIFTILEHTAILRKQRDSSRLEFPWPTVVKGYNSYMGGVDKADMLSSIYGVGRKSNKWWWHCIFFGLVSRTLCNIYVVYKKLIEPSMRSVKLYRSIAQSLITLSKQGKVGQRLSTLCHDSSKKHRKVSYSIPDLFNL